MAHKLIIIPKLKFISHDQKFNFNDKKYEILKNSK